MPAGSAGTPIEQGSGDAKARQDSAVLSVMLFYMLDPIVDRLESWHLPRIVATLVVVCALIGGLGAGFTSLWPQIDSVLMKVPAGPGVTRVEIEQPWRVSDILWTGGMGALGILGQGVTVLFLTIFLLYEDDSFKRKLVSEMDTQNTKRITVRILNDISTQIGRFIWVQAMTSGAVAVATSLALWWIGIAEPLVWGVLAGVLNIVPYFGPLIVTAGLAVVGLLQFGTIEMAALVAGVALAITTIEGMFLTPHLLSRAASLNHVAIFVAIAFWSWAWGVPGMLLAVPMLMVMKAVCDHVEGLKGIGKFVGQ